MLRISPGMLQLQPLQLLPAWDSSRQRRRFLCPWRPKARKRPTKDARQQTGWVAVLNASQNAVAVNKDVRTSFLRSRNHTIPRYSRPEFFHRGRVASSL